MATIKVKPRTRKKVTKGELMQRFISQAATKLHGAEWRSKFTPKKIREKLSAEIRQSVLKKAQSDPRTAMSYKWANRCYHEQIKKIV